MYSGHRDNLALSTWSFNFEFPNSRIVWWLFDNQILCLCNLCKQTCVVNSELLEREACHLNTGDVNNSFCCVTPALIFVWRMVLCQKTAASEVVWSCESWGMWDIYVLHSQAWLRLQSVVLLKHAASTLSHTECKDVLCWLCSSSCSSNYCVTVFKTQSSRCEQRKWQRWVECWSHLWIKHTHTYTHQTPW